MAWVDGSIFEYKGNDLLVMLYLITHMNEEGICSVGMRTIAKDIGITYSAVREAMKRLVNLGAIFVETAHFTAHFTAQSPNLTTICEFEKYAKQQKKSQRTLQRTLQRTPSKPLEERMKAFYEELIPYLEAKGGKYPAPMIRAFYDYWCEPNQTKTKMRYEMQKTWNTAGRLATWANRDNINIKHDNTDIHGKNRRYSSDDAKSRRMEEYAAVAAKFRAESDNGEVR